MNERQRLTSAGIRDAWAFWLSQHPVSLGDLIQAAVKETMTAWLDAHADEIIERMKEGR